MLYGRSRYHPHQLMSDPHAVSGLDDRPLWSSYQSPWLHRAGLLIKTTCFSVFIGFVIVGVVWALLLPWAFPVGVPAWAWTLTCIAAAGAAIGIFPAMNLSEPWHMILRPNDLWLGGTVAGRTIAYERVDLIKLQRSAGAHKLTLRIQRRDRFIHLSVADAATCFNILRDLCGRAAAVGVNNEHYPPKNPEHIEAGRKSLRAETRFKQRELVAATIVCALIAIGVTIGLWFGYGTIPVWASIPMCGFAVFMALGVFGGILRFIEVLHAGDKGPVLARRIKRLRLRLTAPSHSRPRR